MWGTGTIDGRRVAIGLFDFRFMGGSMGSVVGEKVARCLEGALAERIPAIVVSASGGARMQEGTLSLLQLAKTTAPLTRLDAAGIPFISVLTDPTTGGVLASFASLGDVVIAEPRALIGFAGARVASGTVGEELPEGFQTAEFLLEHGFVDLVVARSELRATLARILRVLPVPPRHGRPGEAMDERGWGPIGMLSGLAERLGGAVSETIGIDVEPDAGGNGTRPAARREPRPAGRGGGPDDRPAATGGARSGRRTGHRRRRSRPPGGGCSWPAMRSGRAPSTSSRASSRASPSCMAIAPSATTRRSWAAPRCSTGGR